MRKKRLLIFPLLITLTQSLFAQTIAVGSWEDNEYRSQQLLGKFDSSFSFTVRPLSKPSPKNNWKKTEVSVLPLTLIQQYNTHHPYGWNDGAMIAAKGYQALVSGGVYARYGVLEVQLRPEFVYAANPAYASNSQYGSGGKSFQKLYPGQSSIRLNMGPVAVGVSSENLWWGPGYRSTLLMSNNAPGFGHVFFRTRKPVRTPIGSFEWQIIGGELASNDALPYENQNLVANQIRGKSRYYNGMVLSYHPKWVPGLFVGFTRAVQSYTSYNNSAQLNAFEKYVPVLALAIQKKNNLFDDTLYRDQLASFFLRWVLPKAGTEFYAEYGFNDYGANTRDYLMSPTHSAAYTVGLKKILSLRDTARLELGFELTQMSESPDRIVRPAGNWYVHGQISEGYTYQNQIMGAGAGFGTNVQSAMATWVKGGRRLGLLIERLERDPNTHANKWVDLGFGAQSQWTYQQMVIGLNIELINSSNYLWEKGVNKLNLHSRLSVAYRIK
jgi:hypothetical protein